MPYFLICFVIMLLVFRHNRKRTSKIEKAKSDSFWERERKAQFSRKKDISHLETIHVDWDKLPFIETQDEKLAEIQKKVRFFENKTMVNLSQFDNTDIKLEYGMANFPLISQYDQNYLVFTRYLYEWGKYLYDVSEYEMAKDVLEQVLSYGTDISGVYITLAKIYQSNHELDKVSDLIIRAEGLTTLMRSKIVKELNNILNA